VERSRKQVFRPIEPVAVQEHYALSHAQRRLWISYQLETDQIAYNIPAAYSFNGKLDISAFEKSFEVLTERHESLRTVFITIDGEPRQKILPAQESGFSVIYIDMRKEEGADEKAAAIAMQEAVTAFDLVKGPLLKAKILHLEDERFLFLLTMHHIVSDGASSAVLVKEIIELYENYSNGIKKELPPLRIQYKDYAAWQHEIVSGDTISVHQQYWMDVFKDSVPALAIPTDYARPPVRTFRGDRLFTVVEETEKKKLEALAKKNGASLFMVMLACVKTLLYRYTSQTDIIVGTPVAGRDHADLEGQIGFYINLLALRTNLNEEESFTQLLRRIRKNTLSAYEHQVYPFDKLVSELTMVREPGRAPVFDVRVELNDTGGVEETLEDIAISPFNQGLVVSHFDLTFNFIVNEDAVIVSITYATDLFKRSSIEALSSDLQKIMNAVTDNPDIQLREIVLGDTERKPVTRVIETTFDFFSED
jgi:NRPS condensation-like uncharacterized protein